MIHKHTHNCWLAEMSHKHTHKLLVGLNDTVFLILSGSTDISPVCFSEQHLNASITYFFKTKWSSASIMWTWRDQVQVSCEHDDMCQSQCTLWNFQANKLNFQHNITLYKFISAAVDLLIDFFVGTYRLSSHARLEACVIQTKQNKTRHLIKPSTLASLLGSMI